MAQASVKSVALPLRRDSTNKFHESVSKVSQQGCLQRLRLRCMVVCFRVDFHLLTVSKGARDWHREQVFEVGHDQLKSGQEPCFNAVPRFGVISSLLPRTIAEPVLRTFGESPPRLHRPRCRSLLTVRGSWVSADRPKVSV